jgi:cytochrome c-type biogenesis protein CcmH/NrfF
MRKRALQLCLLLVAAFTMLGAGDPSTRFDAIGHQLVCQCGCTQILLECNHVGCPVSPVMIDELHREIATGLPTAGIFNWFAAKYGAIVLAAPMQGGFDIVAWVVPFAVLGLGIIAVIVTLRVWQRRHARLVRADPVPMATPAAAALRDRIRSETRYGD